MSGTHCYYNGVLMRDCETIEYSSIVEYDESHTHARFVRTRVTVASTLISILSKASGGSYEPLQPGSQHPSTIRIPSIDDETMVGRFEEILQLLAEPRRDFWYAVNGVASTGSVQTDVPKESIDDASSYRLILVATGILPSPGNEPLGEFVQLLSDDLTVKRVDVLDANQGPKSLAVDAKQVFGGNVMRIQATFEICRVLSKPIDDDEDPHYDAQKVRGVVSNTWGCVDGLDDDGAVTHSITGKLVVKDQRYKPNAMRLFAFPLAFPYARLTNRRYTVDPTGLVLQYEYTFKHAGAAPPEGCRNYEATYIEETGSGSAPVQNASMSIKVQGWYDRSFEDTTTVLEKEKVQKSLLLRAAYTILWSRIRGLGKFWNPIPGQQPQNVILQKATVFERVGKPELELRVSVRYNGLGDPEFHNRLENMGTPIEVADYDPRWWPVDNEWGRLPSLDFQNPYFYSASYPYADEGSHLESDYFTGYFQPPGSNRHTLPRITGLTENATDASREWARPGGFVPEEVSVVASDPHPATTNPILGLSPFGKPINAIVSQGLTGNIVFGPVPQSFVSNLDGVSDVQKSGFMYVRWTSEVMHDTDDGIIMLSLSQPRPIPQSRLTELGFPPTNTSTPQPTASGLECSVPIKLHAPKSRRIYSVSATRYGKWPQLPSPVKQIVRTIPATSSAPAVILCVETLLKKEILTPTPKLTADNCNREYTIDARFTYGMSNPWDASGEEGGFNLESLPVLTNPTQNATAENNAVVVRGPSLSPLFGSGVGRGAIGSTFRVG